MSTLELITAHRSDMLELTRLAFNDLSLVLRDLHTLDDVRQGLLDTLPKLVAMYGSAAATLAADWYEELRDAAGVAGSFVAVAADLPGDDRTESLAKWAVGPMFAPAVDGTTFAALKGIVLSKASGGLQRIIADAGRQSVSVSSIADPGATGWQRHASGGCAFCQMLAGRGFVYTRASADFASHDDCSCVAVPAFKGEPAPVRAYTPSLKQSSDADRARVRAFIAANPNG